MYRVKAVDWGAAPAYAYAEKAPTADAALLHADTLPREWAMYGLQHFEGGKWRTVRKAPTVEGLK